MKKHLRISRLCCGLDHLHYKDLDISPPSGPALSPERIYTLARLKIESQEIAPPDLFPAEPLLEKRYFMTKHTIRLLTAATVVVLIAVSAFAAFGGLDYFKSIFGNSAASIENDILSPFYSAKKDGTKMTVEAMCPAQPLRRRHFLCNR